MPRREVPIVLSLANGGRTDSSSATVRTVIPEGTEFVSSDPVPIRRSGSAVSWYFESVPGGSARNISLVLRPIKKGTVLLSATAETLEGLKATKSATGEADTATMKMCEMIKNGVVADPLFGDDSALYEALGYIRKSNRRSGLTRKKNDPAKS